MTRKQADKIRLLLAKIQAGSRIKDSEWPAWQRPRKLAYDDDRTEDQMRREYLLAMGKTEDEANPAAIYWHAWDALERGERCGTCGRPGETECGPCRSWRETMMRRPMVRRATAA